MASSHAPGRTRYTIGILLLAAVSLLTLDFRGVGPLLTVQNGMRGAISAVRTVVDPITEPARDLWHGVFDYRSLADENAYLRDRVAELEGEALDVRADAASFDDLLAEVGLEVPDTEVLVARVVSGPMGNFEPHTLEIDRGTNDGVRSGMGVATAAGLAGKVVDAGPSRSIVQLISAPDFRVGVRLTSTDELGVARGTGDPGSIVIDQGIEVGTEVDEGDAVVTSGSASSLFPPEVVIGQVSGARDSGDGLLRTVTVDLAVPVEDLSYVSVLLFEPEQ